MRKQTKLLKASLQMEIFSLFFCRDLTLSAISKLLLICHGAMNGGNTNNNKLREIKQSIVPLVGSSNRRWDVILTRLRIGHSKFSHGYLMDRSNLSYCDDCLVPVTVMHIVLECPCFQEQRVEHFDPILVALSICVIFCVMGPSDMEVIFTSI